MVKNAILVFKFVFLTEIIRGREQFDNSLLFVVVEIIWLSFYSMADELTLKAVSWHRLIA